MYIGIRVKYPLFLSYFKESLLFQTDFRKKFSNIKFLENPSSGSHADRQTDIRTDRHDEANSHFSQFFESA